VFDEVIELLSVDSEQGSASVCKREILLTLKKKERMLDAYFSGNLSEQDMESLKKKYEDRLTLLQRNLESAQQSGNRRIVLRDQLMSILSGERESDSFLKSMLGYMTVYNDRHVELRLRHLSQIYIFAD
jgi:hypothetical protein